MRRDEFPDGFEQDRMMLVAEITGVEEMGDGMSDEERAAKEELEWQEKLQLFGQGVESEAQEFERLRKPVELRMLEDMRQYYGSEETFDKINKKPKTGSQLNVNITRKKTNAADARLSDMLFPTDDKNWGIVPSPRPRNAVKGFPKSAPDQPQPIPDPQPVAQQQAMPGQQLPDQAQAIATPDQPSQQLPQPQQGQPQTLIPDQVMTGQEAAAQPPVATQEEIIEKESKARAALMEAEMDDQLTECQYSAVGREAIRFGCLLGTGVIKGPVLLGKSRRAWIKKEDDRGNVAYVLQDIADTNPGFELVPTWDFFPTMSATKIEDSEITFQRHWMTRRDLIRLSKREDDGFMKDQIRRVLKNSPDRTPPDYLAQLRNMSDVSAVGDEKRYVVWERHGPIEAEKLQACGSLESDIEVDPLDEYQGVVWVCQGIVIKAQVNPMDTEDQPFSVFNFEMDDSSIFGFGVPYLMRQPQEVVRQVWRMIMDNSGLSVGGQIIINKKIVEPAPPAVGLASWDITPLKVWLMKDSHARAQDAFHVFEFPNHQNELAAIFNLARELADEETGIPVIAEGEQGNNAPQGTQTARGMEMLMNNHNIVMRRAVKNWDDNQTIPNITRLYDWNMQNNPNNDIKGDYSPVAKGSGALLQKETQSRNMLNLVNFLKNPALGFALWVRDEKTVRKLVSSMQHDPDELIKTKEEYDADLKKMQDAAAQNPQGNNSAEIQRMRNDLAYKIHQDKLQDLGADRQFKAALADSQKEVEMMKLAQVRELTVEQIAGQLQVIGEKMKADRTLMADEFKVKLETGSGV